MVLLNIPFAPEEEPLIYSGPYFSLENRRRSVIGMVAPEHLIVSKILSSAVSLLVLMHLVGVLVPVPFFV
jgi:hypothetical protein